MPDIVDMYNHIEDIIFNNHTLSVDKIYKLPEKELQSLVEFIFECIPNSYVEGDSLFNFSTNSSISGNIFPCACLKCKIKNLNNLAFFATLYAEKIIIPSPIDYHYQQYEFYKLKIDRKRLLEDIILLISIKPLVVRGIIGFHTFRVYLCEEHKEEYFKKEQELFNQAEVVRKSIEEKMKEDFYIYTKHEKKDVFIYVDPKSNLILPESIVCAIQKKPNFFEKYINGPDSTLPFEVFKKLGLCDYLLDSIINDFILHNIWKQQYKTTYLTNRPIDTLIIDNLSINKKTFNPLNYIEPVLPLVEGADIENLLKIRDNDYDSFLVYRDKLRELIDNKNYKTKEECQEAYNDLIIPEINKMNNIINKNKKHLKRKIGIDFALSGIVCSLGYYKGFSFDSIVGLLPLLGFSTGIHDINEFNSTELIEDNELYFLWKVNQKKIER